jgi:hypothetical protein
MTNWRKTKLYKSMTQYLACAIAEGFCEGEGASETKQLTAWQWLHDTKLAYKLQGFYGRQAHALVEGGFINR